MSVAIWVAAAFALNFVLGVILVLGVFSFMERRVAVGVLGGVGTGTTVVYAQATLGERMLTVSVGEMKVLVIAAALGAVLGVVGAVLLVEPEL